MVSRSQRKLSMSRKLRVLKSLTCSKSRGRKSAIMDALDYIKELKLKEVKVEKIDKGFVIRVTCPKGRDLLVRILEALEKMGLNVLQARVSSNCFFFCMELIGVEGEGGEKERLDVIAVKQALLNALDSKKVQPQWPKN
ncbi:hypothetical protein ACLOJK_010618 [Asimina triloba]